MCAQSKKSKTTSNNPLVGVVVPEISQNNSSFFIIPMSKIGSAAGETTYYTVPDKRKFIVEGIYKLQDNFYTDFDESGVVFRTPGGVAVYRSQPADDDALAVNTIGQNLISNNKWILNPGFTIGLMHKTSDGSGRLAYTITGTEVDF